MLKGEFFTISGIWLTVGGQSPMVIKAPAVKKKKKKTLEKHGIILLKC